MSEGVKLPLVVVEWIDAAQRDGWHTYGDKFEAPTCAGLPQRHPRRTQPTPTEQRR